jgi:hypothetical protein
LRLVSGSWKIMPMGFARMRRSSSGEIVDPTRQQDLAAGDALADDRRSRQVR